MLHKGVRIETILKVAGDFASLQEFAKGYFLKGGYNENPVGLEDSEINTALEL